MLPAYTCARHPVALRPKVLGDFGSVEEVTWLASMLMTHNNLYVWTFTAHPEPVTLSKYAQTTPNELLTELRRHYPDRLILRHSGAGNVPWAANGQDGPGFMCPAYTHDLKCADCALCWSTSKAVRFKNH